MITLDSVKALSDTLKFTAETPAICRVKFREMRSRAVDAKVVKLLDECLAACAEEVFDHRRDMLRKLPAVILRAEQKKKDKLRGQVSLFD